MSLPPLPIGLSEFKDIREGNFVYVDKTQHMHGLLHMGKRPYFLARPRRFGKSLLISTLQALFEGKRELFAGLWIDQEGRWDWSQQHPVIRLDMSLVSTQPSCYEKASRSWPSNSKLSLCTIRSLRCCCWSSRSFAPTGLPQRPQP